MDIYLVRHGEAAASWGQATDPGLSELGHSQAQDTARELVAMIDPVVQLISSPLLRAQETALPLSEALGFPTAIIDAAYAEIPSPVPMEQRQEWLREFMKQQWESQPETLQSWRTQMLEKLLGLQQQSVIFTHFLVMNTVWVPCKGAAKLSASGRTMPLWCNCGIQEMPWKLSSSADRCPR